MQRLEKSPRKADPNQSAAVSCTLLLSPLMTQRNRGSWFPHSPSVREKGRLSFMRSGTESTLAFVSELFLHPNSSTVRFTQALALISALSTTFSLLSLTLLRLISEVPAQQNCKKSYLPDVQNMPDPMSTCYFSGFLQKTLSKSRKLKLSKGKLRPTTLANSQHFWKTPAQKLTSRFSRSEHPQHWRLHAVW